MDLLNFLFSFSESGLLRLFVFEASYDKLHSFTKDLSWLGFIEKVESGPQSFSSNLKSFNETPEPEWVGDFQQIWRGAHRAIFNCKKPVVGALERFAINGGAALAIACDLLVVGRESFIQVGEAQIGMAAPYNLAWLSLRHPESIIARVVLIGDRIYGKEMKSFGLAHFCCDDSQVLVEAKNLVAKLAAYPEHGLNRIKTVMRDAQGLGADDWFDRFTNADPVKERTKPSRVD